MRQKKVWRYYCDFCGKGGCGKPAIARHERGCTLNPSRRCGLCLHNGGVVQPTAAELLAAIEEDGPKLEDTRKVANNCPACILTAIRLYRKAHPIPASWNCMEDGPHGQEWDFDFRAEVKAWWDEENAVKAEMGEYR